MWKFVLILIVIHESLQTEHFSNVRQNILEDNPSTSKEFNTNLFAESHRADSIKRYRLKDNSHEIFIDKSLVKYCQKPAKCEKLNYTSCMGTKLPYFSSTLNLTRMTSQEEIQMNLQAYRFARFVPMCWPVIQPFLCAWFMPRCENNTVYLPSKVMCKSTLKPCKIFYELIDLYPNCEDETLFPPTCKNDVLELKFNNTEICMKPLVKTDQLDSFHPDFEGCGLSCRDVYYTDNEHKQIHKLVGYCVLICIILTLFTVITFLIEWKTANKYPALAIFYINVCFLVSYSGWMIQFLGMETREDIVCKKDGTLRKSEPSATENLSCVIVFVMVYYFLIAGLVWFVIFTYCWHMSSLQALGKIQERVDKKRAYFHLISWSFPLILTITTMALGEIDGDYISGICFVGFINSTARTGLLLVPLAAAISLGGYIIIRGLILLIRVKIESREIISVHSSRKIRSNIVRMGVFALFMFVFSVITFIYHGYRSMNYEMWDKSLQSYIWCKIISSTSGKTNCKIQSRPSVAMLQLQLIAVFGSGIAMASWIWCDATLHSWARYIRRKFHCEVDEPMKLQKHKIIAQAFAKRKKFHQDGRISIECQNRTDPVGLHFDLNSAASNDLSTTWAANLPRLVNRRGAVPNEVPCSVSSNNQSVDSEMSYSVRHVSIESRRNSGDSQLSVQIAELKTTRKINGRRHRNRYRHKKHNFRRGSRDLTRKLSKTGLKRESSTSLESHLGAQLLNVLSNSSDPTKNFGPNLKRRAGNAGLDGQHINNLLSNGKLVIPYNMNNIKSGSEDENVSVTFSESKFNVVVSNHNLDLNDQLVMKSLCQGLHIEEMKSSGSSNDEDAIKKDCDQEKRESQASRRSKPSRRSKIKYPTDDESDTYDDDDDKNINCPKSDDSSSCPELKRLVQSSLNSGASVGCYEKNRSSKQSKTSIDVAVQANAKEIMTQTAAYKEDQDKNKHKTKQAKTKENKKYKQAQCDKVKKSKDKYNKYGTKEEQTALKS